MPNKNIPIDPMEFAPEMMYGWHPDGSSVHYHDPIMSPDIVSELSDLEQYDKTWHQEQELESNEYPWYLEPNNELLPPR